MSEQLTPAIIRARLEQLGVIEIRPGMSRGDVVYSGHLEIRAEIHRGGATHFCKVASSKMAQRWSADEDCLVVDLDASIVKLWAEMSTRPHIADVPEPVAVWWDPRIQDWGTSPNAPEGWPAPAKDPEDIRARLAVVLEGVEVHYLYNYDGPPILNDHVSAYTSDRLSGYGRTEDDAYLSLWGSIVASRPKIR